MGAIVFCCPNYRGGFVGGPFPILDAGPNDDSDEAMTGLFQIRLLPVLATRALLTKTQRKEVIAPC